MVNAQKMFRACFGKAFLPNPNHDSARLHTKNCVKSPPPVPIAMEGQPETVVVCHTDLPAQHIEQAGTTVNGGAIPPANTRASLQADNGTASARNSTDAAPAPPSRTGLNASRIQEMQPENVAFCYARQILDGVQLAPRELGRGTYGIVVVGSYRGLPCAVKIMLSQGVLDRAALRELLLGPSLVHLNVVSTYASRCAQLTDEFFDFLEGERRGNHGNDGPRMLEPIPLNSGDGFGDPAGGIGNGIDPLLVLHQVMHALEAKTGQTLVVVVQQFCDKGTLDNAIRKGAFRGSNEWPERVALRSLLRTAAELARGLLRLHDAGVVHGDIKPANVLLHSSREDRRGFIAKVTDFGLCHVLPQAANSIFTESWGSIAYMAPEAFIGKVSRATDVWAFGVCIWEMVTGLRPYARLNHTDVIMGVRDDTLRLTWPAVSPMAARLVRLAKSCLSHCSDMRPGFDVIVEELVAIEQEIRAELLTPQFEASSEEVLEVFDMASLPTVGLPLQLQPEQHGTANTNDHRNAGGGGFL